MLLIERSNNFTVVKPHKTRMTSDL